MPLFKKLILIGRPASGKSEFIDFIKKIPQKEREKEYHIGAITELDDFLWLWEKFVDDDIWEASGHARLFSKKTEQGYCITNGILLDYCLEKFNQEILRLDQEGTVLVEFSRGKKDGGYTHALHKFSDHLLRDAAILFLWTSYAEALRRNETRYQEKLKHSVLAHRVPPQDMERFGKDIDWLELTHSTAPTSRPLGRGERRRSGSIPSKPRSLDRGVEGLTGEKPSGWLKIRSNKIPFVTMNNEPEVKDLEGCHRRYKEALDLLIKEAT